MVRVVVLVCNVVFDVLVDDESCSLLVEMTGRPVTTRVADVEEELELVTGEAIVWDEVLIVGLPAALVVDELVIVVVVSRTALVDVMTTIQPISTCSLSYRPISLAWHLPGLCASTRCPPVKVKRRIDKIEICILEYWR